MARTGVSRIRPVGVRDDAAGVSDIVGSILLVAITVLMAAGLGLLLLSFDGPADTQHTRLSVVLAAGSGGTWSDGDEELRIQHMGGERMSQGDARIVYEQAGVRTSIEGAALGSAFSDGDFRIGETWSRTLTIAVNEALLVQILGLQGDGATVLSSTTAVAGATATALCLGPDVTPPEVEAWDIEPDNVNSLTAVTSPLGDVVVTATIEDECSSVASSPAPVLTWCLDTACGLPPYTNTIPMAPAGGDDWSATITAQDWLQAALDGKELRFNVQGMTDTASPANSANSGSQSESIEVIGSYRYVNDIVNTHAGGLGTLDPVNDETKANSDLTPGDHALLTEVSSGAASATVEQYGGTPSAGGSVTSPEKAKAPTDDGDRATDIAVGDWVELSGFTQPAGASAITGLEIHADVRKSANMGQTVTYRLDYDTASTVDWQSGAILTAGQADTLVSRDLGTSVALADMASLKVRVAVDAITGTGARTLEVDRLWIKVTYSAATYRLDMQADITGVGAGSVHYLEGLHQQTVDTYDILVYDHTAGTWQDCEDLDGAPSGFTCTLDDDPLLPTNGDQVSAAGVVLVRFVDKNLTNTSPGTLGLDYLRVATV